MTTKHKNATSKGASVVKPLDLRRTHSTSSSSSLIHPSHSYTPITAHYKLNNTLYTIFQHLLQAKDYVTALAVGVQFARVALLDLPQHGYYNAPKYHKDKIRHARLALKVCRELNEVVLPRVEKNVKRCERRLQKSNSGIHSSSSSEKGSASGKDKRSDIRQEDLTGIKERIEEARLLLDVAKEQMATIESKNDTVNNIQNPNRKERIDLPPQDKPMVQEKDKSNSKTESWVQTNVSRILDCGDVVSNSLCPANHSLDRVPEEEVVVEGISPSRQQLQKKYGLGKANAEGAVSNTDNPPSLEFVRSNSAPVVLNSTKKQTEKPHSKPKQTSTKSSKTKQDTDKAKNGSKNESKTTKTKKEDSKAAGKQHSKQLTKVKEKSRVESKPKKGKTSTSKKTTSVDDRRKNNGDKVPTTTANQTPDLVSEPPMSSSSSESKAPRESSSSTRQQKAKVHQPLKNSLKVSTEEMNGRKQTSSSELSRTQSPAISNPQQDDSTSASTVSTNSSDNDDERKLAPNIARLPQSHSNPSEDSDLQRALYLSGLEFQTQSSIKQQNSFKALSHSSNTIPMKGNLKRYTSDQLCISTLSDLYRQDFEELRRRSTKRIQITYIDTYQGRLRDTVNGCTVIAPLLAIQFLKEMEQQANRTLNYSEGQSNKRDFEPAEEKKEQDDWTPSSMPCIQDFMLSASTIKDVIDSLTPIILPKVRDHLGLHKDALIIPSDVHDYLYQHKLLRPEQYVDVFGGNILDETHLDNFIKAFSSDEYTPMTKNMSNNDASRKGLVPSHLTSVDTGLKELYSQKEKFTVIKLAATFFFHEHVICIHRVTQKIDSVSLETVKMSKKSGKKNLFHRIRGSKKAKISKEVTTQKEIRREETWFEIIDSLPSSRMLRNSDDVKKHTLRGEDAWIPATTRIRCMDIDSLKVCLRWYACSKFSEEDRKFINSYQWDDSNFNFDPRVFQSFLWSL